MTLVPSPLRTQRSIDPVVDLTRGGVSHTLSAHIGVRSAIDAPRSIAIRATALGEAEDSLRWRSTLFTLVQIAGGLFCPQLVVDLTLRFGFCSGMMQSIN